MDLEKEISLRGAVYRREHGQGRISVATRNTENAPDTDAGTIQQSDPVRCEFDLVQFQNGNIYAFCSTHEDDVSQAMEADWLESFGSISFDGVADNGLNVRLDQPLATSYTMSSSAGKPLTVQAIFNITHAHFTQIFHENKIQDSPAFWHVRFPLVNLEMPPVPDHDYADALAGQRHSAVVAIQCGGAPFYLEAAPDANETLKELERSKGVAVTATATTFIAARSDLDARKKSLEELQAILTLLMGTRINRLGCDVLTPQDEVVESWWHCAVTRPYRGTSLLNHTLPGDYKMRYGTELFCRSAETMLSHLPEREEVLGIRSLIYGFLDATILNNYLELRGLMISGCVEVLRARYLASTDEVNMVPAETFVAIVPELQSRMRTVLQDLLPSANDAILSSMTGHLRNINYTSFRRALRSLFKSFELQGAGNTPREVKQATEAAISAFITTRDALVHYGNFAVPSDPIDGWDEERIRETRWEQYQFIEKVAAGLLAAALGWKDVRPEFVLPPAPDVWQDDD